MPDWKRRVDRHGNWYSSTGMVSQQEVFKKIDKKFMNDPEVNLNLYHIKGHVDIRKQKDIDKAVKSFQHMNGFMVDMDKLFYLIKMNNICDNYAVQKLQEGLDKLNATN